MDNFPNRSIFTESLFSLLSIANPLVSNKMKDTELRQERDRDLYRTYVRGLREKDFSSLQEAAEWAISQPAERFYVSSKVLVNYIASRRAGASEDGMHKANRDRMRELYDRFIAFCTANPSCQLPRERICEALVDEPAPRFYIDLQMAMKVIQRERLRHRQELINRINR